jgi:predicted permease
MAWYRFASRRSRERERAEEMRAHLELLEEQLIEQGVSREAARREARLAFGNPRAKLEAVRDSTRWAIIDPLALDVRDAIRGFRTNPGFTAVVLAVLALGIGTATSIFSVVDAVVLRRLPFPASDRLVAVSSTRGASPLGMPMAVPDATDYRAMQDVFEGLAATAGFGATLTEGGQAEPLRGARVTADLFDVLGVQPRLGRPFTAENETAGRDAVALISDGLWRRRFGGDPRVVGRRLRLDSGEVEIVGVMPAGFAYPLSAAVTSDLWVPFVPKPQETVRGNARSSFLTLVGRLRPDVTIEQAQARMEQITASLAVDDPAWFREQGVLVRSLRTAVAGGESVRKWMLMLLAAVGCVLILTCVNVANLLLARATARNREARIRAALGASRWQLVRAALVESLLLSTAGTLLGVAVAYRAVDILRAAIPTTVPLVGSVAIDFRVLAVATAAALLIGVLLGVLPALQVARADLASRLRTGDRTHTADGRTRRVRAGLLVVQVALAVVLVVGAGLFASSFIRVMSVDLGIDYRNVLVIPVRSDIAGEALERLAAVPGVEAVGALDQNLPLQLGGSRYSIAVRGHEGEFWDDDAVRPHWVLPGYLKVMRLPLLAGRWFDATDVGSSEPVVVLSDEAARRYFAGRDPLGETVDMGGRKGTVIGVVGNVRLQGPENDVAPEIYFPSAQMLPPPQMLSRMPAFTATSTLLVRTGRDPGRSGIIPTVKAVIWSVSPTQEIGDVKTLADRLGALVAPRRFNMVILSMFGVMGTLIAAIGIFGVMAFIVTQRTREIAIRIALGAQARRVRLAVLGSASAYLLAGLALGLGSAAWLAGSLEGLLFQVEPRDALVYGASAVVLLATGLAAAFVPARRASMVDPLVALRLE